MTQYCNSCLYFSSTHAQVLLPYLPYYTYAPPFLFLFFARVRRRTALRPLRTLASHGRASSGSHFAASGRLLLVRRQDGAPVAA